LNSPVLNHADAVGLDPQNC